jgi:hypothetical protein
MAFIRIALCCLVWWEGKFCRFGCAYPLPHYRFRLAPLMCVREILRGELSHDHDYHGW